MRNKITFYQRKSLQKNGSVEIIFNNLRNDIKEDFSIKTKILKYTSSNIFKVIYNIFDSIFSQGDINHITGDIQYAAILLKKNKTILTVLDCIYLEKSKGIKHIIFKYLFLIIPINNSRYITTISEFSKNSILKHYPNINKDKIVVIPVSISDTFKFKNKKFNNIEPRLLQVGTNYNKNIINLIKSIKNIKCVLVIIGPLTSEIYEQLILNNINYENYIDISESDIIKHYEDCDLVTFVSTYEGFGMPIIEANTIGRCVITSNCSSMPEIANNAACLVDPFSIDSIRDGILKILNDNSYREYLINNGLINSKRYNSRNIHNQYLTLYNNLNE